MLSFMNSFRDNLPSALTTSTNHLLKSSTSEGIVPWLHYRATSAVLFAATILIWV